PPHGAYLRTTGNHPTWWRYRLQIDDLLVLHRSVGDHHLLLGVPVLHLGADVLGDALLVLLSLVLGELVVIDLRLVLLSVVEQRFANRFQGATALSISTTCIADGFLCGGRIFPQSGNCRVLALRSRSDLHLVIRSPQKGMRLHPDVQGRGLVDQAHHLTCEGTFRFTPISVVPVMGSNCKADLSSLLRATSTELASEGRCVSESFLFLTEAKSKDHGVRQCLNGLIALVLHRLSVTLVVFCRLVIHGDRLVVAANLVNRLVS